MQVKVDDERCQGHGLCRISAPDLFFAREEDGNAYVKDENVPAGPRGRRGSSPRTAAPSWPSRSTDDAGRPRAQPRRRARRTPTTGSSRRRRWPTAAGSPTSASTAWPSAPWRWRRCAAAADPAAGQDERIARAGAPARRLPRRRDARWSATSAPPTPTPPATTSPRRCTPVGLAGVRIGVIRGDDVPRAGARPRPRAARARARRWAPSATGSSRRTPTSARTASSTACAQDAQIVLGGRLADPSLFVGPDLPRARLGARRLGPRRPRHAGRPPARVRRALDRRQLRGPAVPRGPRPAQPRLPARRRRGRLGRRHQAARHRWRRRRADR